MKIAINATFNPWGGSLSQLNNLLRYISLDESLTIIVYIRKKDIESVSKYCGENTKLIISKIASISIIARIIWEQTVLPFLLIKEKIDILFCPGNIAPIFSSVKTIQWIGTIGPFWEGMYNHKIGWVKRIKYPINKFFMYKSAQKSDAVIFESDYTKKLFNYKYGIISSKSFVINIGKDKYFSPNSIYEKENQYIIYSPFVLCVSHLYPYKNIPRMIEAFAIAKKNNIINLKLLIAGSKVSNKYYKNILDTIIETNTLDDVILLGSISKEDLRFLYSNCEFLIFPSPCENFAYTLVEAMCCGTPIICTNTTAMPETCQEAAIYFDPNNTKEMAEKIELLICDENLRETLSRKSLERVKELPDYKEVTIKTLDIMRNLYSQSIS